MNKSQTNHYRMMGNVQITLDENPNAWNSIPVVLEVKNHLDEVIQRIEEVNESTGASSIATTQTKDNLRDILIEKVPPLAGRIYVLGEMTVDPHLKQMGDITRNDLYESRETDLIARLNPLIDCLRENLESLKEYGITEAQIDDLETTLNTFKVMIGQPRNIQNKVYAAIRKIDELVDTGMDLLYKKMDKLMLMYRNSFPEFYEQYERARVIVD